MEAKWVPSCSPWQMLDTLSFPSSRLHFQRPLQPHGPQGWVLRWRRPLGPFPDQRTTGLIPTALLRQASSPEHSFGSIPSPLRHPRLGQRPSRMPSAPPLTCKVSDTSWKSMKYWGKKWLYGRLCYFSLGLGLLHCKMGRGIHILQGPFPNDLCPWLMVCVPGPTAEEN